ncbi:penicillin-binding protein activator LpoB [Helicobacter kayseriensis]|uniref:penicillin-binding protein activator LpoB n=1 Tax=Helicobacter kayseriensis TaxID=2905877 RepID=UPI001E43BA47|nr:penicillin-binding protein activator LpoB [Helicobacter kayseriensis]MCE3047535.1 penicillin-binding protein activator LpoB [Helicobacter kayseriensis]MCE3048857.1 penicillin-binding protein activator LpoB [Helicobacter kayseriensis]
MKRWMLICVVVLGFYGCAGGVKYIDPSNPSYVSAGLDFNDLLKASSSSIDSLLKSSFVQSLPSGENAKVLVISDFINDTMQKLDMNQVARRVARSLRESQKFVLSVAMAGSGEREEEMIQKARGARGNQEYKQNSTINQGRLLAPSFSLSGKVVQRNMQVGKEQRIDYYFLMSLVDLENGIVVWDHEVNISKIASGNSSSW